MPDGLNSLDLPTGRAGSLHEAVNALQSRLLNGSSLSSADAHYLCEMARRGLDGDSLADAAAELPTGHGVEDEELAVAAMLLRGLAYAVEAYRTGPPGPTTPNLRTL